MERSQNPWLRKRVYIILPPPPNYHQIQVQLLTVLLLGSADCYNKVEEKFGKVTLVGNVAGILTEENWSKMIDVNLVSQCKCNCYI